MAIAARKHFQHQRAGGAGMQAVADDEATVVIQEADQVQAAGSAA